MIQREPFQFIARRLNDPNAILLMDPRQSGKTTLLRSLSTELNLNLFWWSGDYPDIRADLQNATSSYLRERIGNKSVLIIDEAQRIENIGLLIKLIVDEIPGVKVIATGSFSFDLANKVNEPPPADEIVTSGIIMFFLMGEVDLF
jgi:uncharacterized protein